MESRNWSISFVWSIWSVLLAGSENLAGESKKPDRPKKPNKPERPAGFALSSPRSSAWTERGRSKRRKTTHMASLRKTGQPVAQPTPCLEMSASGQKRFLTPLFLHDTLISSSNTQGNFSLVSDARSHATIGHLVVACHNGREPGRMKALEQGLGPINRSAGTENQCPLARIIHEGSSRKRADAKRDGHSET